MILMLCSIWYHLHKLKKREKPSGGVTFSKVEENKK